MGGTTTISTSETKAEALRLQSSAYGATVAVVHGKTRIAGNLLDYGNFKAIPHTDVQEMGGKGGGGVQTANTTYTYVATVLMALCEGPITDVTAIWAGKTKYLDHHGPGGTEDILIHGAIGQAAWSGLSTLAAGGTHSLGYSGLALFGVLDYELGATADVPNHNFEVVGLGAYQVHSTMPDADVSVILQDWITHPRYGRGLSISLGGMSEVSQWSRASGLMFSPALTEQAPAADRIKELCELAHVAVVPADGKLNFVPLATEAVSRTVTDAGGTQATYSYTPDITPLFELGPDQIMAGEDEPLIRVTRKAPADAFNTVKVEFRNRANDYAVDVAVVEDRATVDLYGPLVAPVVRADWIQDHQTAQTYGRMKLQRYLTQLREYEFNLPWNYSDLLPTNLLLINDEDQGIQSALVRVTEMAETDSGWTVKAVDCPAIQSAAPVYGLPDAIGFKQRRAALPGSTVIGAVFEAPFDLTTTGLEVWMAISGTNSDWGGAHIWMSLDGVNYRKVSTNFGSSRYGKLSGAISSGSMGISNVVGKILSGTAQEAGLKATLCYVGGASPEYLSYITATLASANAYTLSGLVRAQYGTTDASAHAADDVWVRCDDALAKSGPLDLNLIGKQIYIKAQSFNVFGLQTQDLADVTATTYTITGRYSIPTPDPANQLTNGTFSANPLGSKPDEWSDGTVVEVTGQAFTRALRFDGAAVAAVNTKIPVRGGDRLWFGGWGLADEASSSYIYWTFDFYSGSGALISSVDATIFEWGLPARRLDSVITPREVYGWIYRSGVVDVPSGAAYSIPRARWTGSLSATTHPSYLSQLVVRRQIATFDIQSGAATGAYNINDTTSVTITQPEFGTGDAQRQVLQTLSISTPVACAVVITVFAEGFAQNAASGFSASFGGGVTLAVYSPGFSGWNVTITQGINTAAGANVSNRGTISLSDIRQVKAGTWNFELRASKSDSGVTATVSNIRFRVEVIKL